MAQEPGATLLARPLLRYWLATRPPFLAASVVPVLLGAAAAGYQGFSIQIGLLLWCVLGIMLIHAGVNVLNDYYDEQNGTDRRNTQRIYPFTGGSRFIQNGVLTASNTLYLGLGLLAAGMLVGLGLTWVSGVELLWIGLAGFVIGWGYSAPPLLLNSRGLGELAVAVGVGVLAPLGAWYVQARVVAGYPVLVSVPLALLLMNILVINQFPDREADAASGKHHWVVRFGAIVAARLYLAAVLLAGAVLVLLVMLETLPAAALLSLLPVGIALRAALQLLENAQQPTLLEPAIKMTIGSAILHGVLLTLSLWLG